MKIVLFYHSLVSDWNHGNAHFLRGIATELISRGHEIVIYEPRDGWSRCNLIAQHGQDPVIDFHQRYPALRSVFYHPDSLDLARALRQADAVIVHEWNQPEWIRAIGEHRAAHGGFKLLFHDTHHCAVSDSGRLSGGVLDNYDGVLAFGESLRRRYLANGWSRCVRTWHEAADTRVFQPRPAQDVEGDLVWIGNWGDDERSAELREFLIAPARCLGLRAAVHGVRYPDEAKSELRKSGIEYRDWLPNFRVPEVFGRYAVTVHIPRRPYRRELPGIPTIRVFEALACGIPLVCAPWEDCEHLFEPGADYLLARSGNEMCGMIRDLLRSPASAKELAAHGLETIRKRHTCVHRVDELLEILAQ